MHQSTNNPFLQTTPGTPPPDMILSSEEENAAPPIYSQGDYDGPIPGDEKKGSLFPEPSSSSRGNTSTPAEPSSIPSPPPVPGSPQMLPQNSLTASHFAPTPPGYSTALISAHPDVPPPSFSRSRALGLSYAQFQPTFLVARSKTLHKGFPMTSPPSHEEPHLFVTHDVNEVDWLQFLSNLRVAGSLTEKDIRRSHLPIISQIPFVNSLSAYGIQKIMKSRKETVVVKVIDSWNHHFFEPRKIRLILMKGSVKLSGADERPIGDLHTPSPSIMSPWTVGEDLEVRHDSPGSSSSGKPEHPAQNEGKGKQKATADDETFRLFLVPI